MNHNHTTSDVILIGAGVEARHWPRFCINYSRNGVSLCSRSSTPPDRKVPMNGTMPEPDTPLSAN